MPSPEERVRETYIWDIHRKEAAYALSGAASFQELDIIALLELKKAELEYVVPATVVFLQQKNNA